MNTGSIKVISGKWLPPSYGLLVITTSPGCNIISERTAESVIGIEPKCTGMWAAWATSSPLASKMAQEKSLLSFMLGEKEERVRIIPISSAMELKSLLKTSISIISGIFPGGSSRGSVISDQI